MVPRLRETKEREMYDEEIEKAHPGCRMAEDSEAGWFFNASDGSSLWITDEP